MKITLEPTDKSKYGIKVTIETISDDDLDIYGVVEELIIPALIGYGFHPKCVEEALSNNEEVYLVEKQ